jgi:pyruvate/2-oxoglutarate dehydrogenase complex dihydrolipoamide dehydrogenase (E3) component
MLLAFWAPCRVIRDAGVLQGLGTKTSLFVRHERALRHFDHMVSENLDTAMKKSGKYRVSFPP